MKNLLLTISLNGLSRKEQTRKRIICAEKVYQTLTGYGDLLCCCLPKTWRKTQSLWQVSKSPGHVSASEGLCMSVPIPGGSCTPSETSGLCVLLGEWQGTVTPRGHCQQPAGLHRGHWEWLLVWQGLCDTDCVTGSAWQCMCARDCVWQGLCDRVCLQRWKHAPRKHLLLITALLYS